MKTTSRFLNLAIFISFCFFTVRCGELKEFITPPKTNTPMPPSLLMLKSQKPDIRGKISDIFKTENKINAIQVVGILEDDTKYDQATVRITNKTRIYISKENSYEVVTEDQLTVGMKVEALFTGLILERYPVSAEAEEILIIP